MVEGFFPAGWRWTQQHIGWVQEQLLPAWCATACPVPEIVMGIARVTWPVLGIAALVGVGVGVYGGLRLKRIAAASDGFILFACMNLCALAFHCFPSFLSDRLRTVAYLGDIACTGASASALLFALIPLIRPYYSRSIILFILQLTAVSYAFGLQLITESVYVFPVLSCICCVFALNTLFPYIRQGQYLHSVTISSTHLAVLLLLFAPFAVGDALLCRLMPLPIAHSPTWFFMCCDASFALLYRSIATHMDKKMQ